METAGTLNFQLESAVKKCNYVGEFMILIKRCFIAITLISLSMTIFSCSLNNKENTTKSDSSSSVGIVENSSEKSDKNNSSENEETLYDSTDISKTYLKGDSSELDDFQKKIYEKASEIISDNINDSMTDYEKELAVHDYLISHCTYDDNHLLVFERHDENSVNPYGALINGKAICSGYTTSFKMFMDMLKIPCKSIKASDKSGEDHAWNMVKINGEWYYVDVTWDDPVPDYEGRLITHSYFNVTEDIMKKEHEWNSSDYPKANSIECSYVNQSLKNVSDISEIGNLLKQTKKDMSDTLYVEFDKALNVNISELGEDDDMIDVESKLPELNKIIEKFQSENNCLVICSTEKDGNKTVLKMEIAEIQE